MQRYAIIKDGVVLNSIEYEEPPTGTPPGFEDGAFAIQNSVAGPNWLYIAGEFINPTPIVEKHLLKVDA